LLVFAAHMYFEIVSHYLTKKKELYGDTKDDDEELDLLEINQERPNGESVAMGLLGPSFERMLSRGDTLTNMKSSVKRGVRQIVTK
jgi:hypothetical protein